MSKLLLLGISLLIGLPTIVGVRAQVVTPPPDQLRFQMILNEPVATLDRRAVVAATSAMVVRDRRTGQCYVAITIGQSAAMAAAPCAE
jgi:hypothetical protein